MKKSQMKKSILLALLLTFVATSAFALTAPASGSFGFELFDIGVNGILKGAIGMTAGIVGCVGAAILAMRQQIMPAVGMVLASVFLLNADSFLAAVGAVIM